MNNRIVCHTHLGSVSLGSIQNPHLWSRRRRTTVLDCFYAGLQPLLQRRRLPTAITGSILPLLLVGDCFTAVAAVKIWLEQESTPHHARLLLVEGACAVIPLPTNCRRREKDGQMGVGYSHKPIKIDLHTHRHREREREREREHEAREQQQKGSSPEPGSEELGRARPNGGAMYPGADEVSKRLPVSDEPLLVPTSPSESKPTLLLEVARRITSEVVVVVALV
jgi:hypothetical protein